MKIPSNPYYLDQVPKAKPIDIIETKEQLLRELEIFGIVFTKYGSITRDALDHHTLDEIWDMIED